MRRNEYIGSVVVKDTLVNIGLDDYGQCYFFEYYSTDTKEIKEIPCGSYNENFLEEVYSYFDYKGTTISLYGEEYWNKRIDILKEQQMNEKNPHIKDIIEKQITCMQKDEYEIYNFEELYQKFKQINS